MWRGKLSRQGYPRMKEAALGDGNFPVSGGVCPGDEERGEEHMPVCVFVCVSVCIGFQGCRVKG